MNVEILKQSNYIIFEAICGSIAYGTNNPNSDVDLRGLFIWPKNERITLLDVPKEISNESQDIKYYELEKFLKLAADCNPSIIELMYLPEDCVKIKTNAMDKLINNRSLFISKKAYHTFSGYAFSMLHKAKSQNRFVNNPKSEERPTKEDFCFIIPSSKNEAVCDGLIENDENYLRMPSRPIPLKKTKYDLSKYHCAGLEQTSNIYRLYYYGNESKGVFRGDNMLTVESIPFSDEETRFAGLLIYNEGTFNKELSEWKSYWTWRRERNEKRWQDQENGIFQYDRKNASHCVRLILSGKHILSHGEPIVRFTGNDLQYLKDIREGKIQYEKLMNDIEIQMKELEYIYKESTLPWGSDIKKIDSLYRELSEYTVKEERWY